MSEVEDADARLESLLSRIATLTETLRAGESNETTRKASQMLLSDLAAVAAQFRSRTNAMRESLSRVMKDVRSTLDDLDKPANAS
jgi:DNA anti-recombination protein RmuC